MNIYLIKFLLIYFINNYLVYLILNLNIIKFIDFIKQLIQKLIVHFLF